MNTFRHIAARALQAGLLCSCCGLMLSLTACSDDDIASPGTDTGNVGRFAYTLRDTQDSLDVRLNGITAAVQSVSSPFASWLDIQEKGKDSQGNTLLALIRRAATPTDFTTDSATVHLDGGKNVRIVVGREGEIIPAGLNGTNFTEFNKHWWDFSQVDFYTKSGRDSTTLDMPWNDIATSNIPSYIFRSDGIRPEKGWMMAYNLFASKDKNSGLPNGKPYFMLYNKYTGVLRVFYCQEKGVGTGGEFSFTVTPDYPETPKYPFYNSLQYGIPMCNTNVQNKGNVLGITNGSSTFQQKITPYFRSEHTLRPGWYCFDIDWSAYNPAATTHFTANDRLAIDCATANNQTITMSGELSATSIGTIEGLSTGGSSKSTSSSSGISELYDLYMGNWKNGKKAFESFTKGDYLTGFSLGIGVAVNVGKTIWGLLSGDEDEEESDTKTNTNTGTIQQTFTGQLSLKGYITSSTSNEAENVQFRYNAFSDNDAIGAGVWSLKDNPTVYVVNDLLMGDDDDFACMVNDSCYNVGSNDPLATNHLHMMTFFDPTSLNVNVNTNVFKNISNVKLSYTYGVYPNQQSGHTNAYRKGLLDLTVDEPVFINKAGNTNKRYYSDDNSASMANMKYVNIPYDEIVTANLNSDDFKATPAIYDQKGSYGHYYGYAGYDQSSTSNDFFVADPVVFLPTHLFKQTDSDKRETLTGCIYDFEAPDFVVCVILTFDYVDDNGQKAQAVFSKRFVPEVKGISTSEMLQKETALRSYLDGGARHTALPNGVGVSCPTAERMLTGFFSTCALVKENQ